jgi:F-type H+-transporting ATPase subunit alpha
MAIDIKPEEIASILKQKLGAFRTETKIYEVGTVLSVGDGIARVYGLSKVMASELVQFSGGPMGMALN